MTIKNTYGEKFNVIPSTYKENENTYKLNGVFVAGMCYYFSEWLNDHDIAEDTTEDVINNTSGLRDGCRLDIYDNYYFDDEDKRYQISYIWALENGIIYAAIYDSIEDRYIGDIEIKA
jgi:hypothetical protein|nr:MAG TPA: hypothetical protein [Caudoviricetes sp.]